MRRSTCRAFGFLALACATFSSGAAFGAAPYTVLDLYSFRGQAGDAVGGQVGGMGNGQPMLWGAGGTAQSLAPQGYSGGSVLGIGGLLQVGYSYPTGGSEHAMAWEGSSDMALDLNGYGGWQSSAALAVGGPANSPQIVGSYAGGFAVLWSGPYFATITPLNGIHYLTSEALATDGVHQAGWGIDSSGKHALMWAGSADSVIDLTPTNIAGYTGAEALGVLGQQQVGEVINALGKTHAVLWNGSAGSAVDLQPLSLSGITESQAVGTNGVQQVGWGDNGTPQALPSALVWSGSANSVIDLQNLLNPTEFVSSQAYSIDANGNVFGVATDTSGLPHAIEWQAVPEPTALASGCLAVLLLVGRK